MSDAMREEALAGWSRGRWLGAPSGRRLFRAIVLVRWLALLVSLATYVRNLSIAQMEYGHFVPVLAGAALYTIVLTVASDRVYDWLNRSDLFLAIDYSVTLVVFALTGSVWNPFLMFGACSFLFSGLRGNVRHGLVAGLVVGGLLILSVPLKQVSVEEMVAADGFVLLSVYVLQFVGFSTAWSYSVRLLGRLEAANASLDGAREGLAQTNEALDQRQRELLALHRIRQALLRNVDAEETVGVVMQALASNGFADPKTWLLSDGALTLFPREPGAAELDAYGTHPVAVAAHDRETVVTEGGCETPEEGVPPGCAAAPVIVEGDVVAVIAVRNDPEAPVTGKRLEMLEVFADQLALGLSHLSAYERARELAVADERNRVTTDMHENVVQRLYEASALTESLSAEARAAGAADDVRVLRDSILGALQDLRFAVLDWRRLEGDAGPLELAKRYAREFKVVSGIQANITCEGEPFSLPAQRAADLLRILQEGFSNVWRHSGAQAVDVRLAFEEDGIAMRIADDGTGFDPEATEGEGVGVQAMKDRAERGGGRFRLETSPGEGTLIDVWIPRR